MSAPIPLDACPTCGYVMDRATTLDGADVTPKPDDLTICMSCGDVLQFDATLTHVVCKDWRKHATIEDTARILDVQAFIAKNGRLKARTIGSTS